MAGEKINEQILNRRKYLMNVKSDLEETGDLPSSKDIVYVKRGFKTSQAVVFVLSNGTNQIMFPENDNILLVIG